MASTPSKEVTKVISRNIKASHEKDYDDWLRRYMILERNVPGYLGTTIIAPGGNSSSVRYIINRFADKASLDAMGKFRRSPQANRGSEQLLYSVLRDSDRPGDVVYSARLQNCSRAPSMENGFRCIHCRVRH